MGTNEIRAAPGGNWGISLIPIYGPSPGNPDQIRQGLRRQFLHNLGAMGLDGLLADAQVPRHGDHQLGTRIRRSGFSVDYCEFSEKVAGLKGGISDDTTGF